MARVTPEEAALKQANRLKAALPEMSAGVQRVQQAPTQQAAAQKDKMLQNLTASVQSGRWEAGLRKVSLSDWQQKMIDKGVPRVAAGIDAARQKQTEFYGKLLPYQDGVRQKIRQMPSTTLEDNINRMTAYIREMAKFKK